MNLQKAVQGVCLQLCSAMNKLSREQYVYHSATLSNATIGQHVRHIIEMFLCLERGYESGLVNYEKRDRDKRIETDKAFAEKLLHEIAAGLNKADKSLTLEACYSLEESDAIRLATNYQREIVYNLEHAIHHMALIKIGIRELTDIELPEGFGVASSTLKYQKECAQ